ncbi:hypothetical protein DPMN_055061 [Dreissena polymorpha]|uniref:Uncharacterized protein n=1 Tax=Dreissena polymorpha TaxID=45954 RepID=A0A9D4CRL4_DREPO|nr:hypothetical protein DPMN_055061 [Dreissena polymorpha]
MYPKTAPNIIYRAQYQRIRPEHDCQTCLSTRAPNGDRQTTTSGLIWIRLQARLSVQDCSSAHASGWSTSRPSEEKLY